jgi:hypothetical protein
VALKKLAIVVAGETVRFRVTPYGRCIVSCTCGELFCKHRFKAIPEWSRFKREAE